MALIRLTEEFETILREELTRIYDLAYVIGKRDGKNEILQKIDEYFELKEKGEINGK